MESKKNKMSVRWIITVLLTVLVLLIPTDELFTEQIRIYLSGTVFCVFLIAFELVSPMLVSIILPTFYTVSGVAPMATAFGSYAGVFIWMVLGAFVLGNVMDETGLLKRLAYRMIMLMGGSFSGAVFSVYLVAAFINLITFGSAWVIALPVIMGIIKALRLKPGRESAIVCFAGMAGTVDSGVFMYIPSSIVMIDNHVQSVIPGFHATFFTCFIYNGLILAVSLLAIWLLLRENKRYNQKHNVKAVSGCMAKEYFSDRYHEMGKLSVYEIKSMVLFLLILFYMIASTFTRWNSSYAFMVIPYAAFLPGVGVGKKAETALKNVNYNGLFFATSCVAIGVVGNFVGFNTWLTNITVLLVSGQGALFTCILLLLITIVGNFVLTPSALMSGFGGALAQIAMAVGMKPIAAVMLLYFSANMIFLPHEISGYLLLYGMGYWPIREFVKQQSFKTVLYLIFFVIVIYPFWRVTGLL